MMFAKYFEHYTIILNAVLPFFHGHAVYHFNNTN